jgi:uncharacterized membrane protein YebE (DUF533 family)
MAESVQSSDITAVSDSTFHMWRCIIALAKSDGQIEDPEIAFINNALATLKGLSADQRLTLGEDMVAQNTDLNALLERVTDKEDRAIIFHFGTLLAESDDDLEPGEEAVLTKLAATGNVRPSDVKQYFADTQAILGQKRAAAELKALAEAQPKESKFRLMMRYLINRMGL